MAIDSLTGSAQFRFDDVDLSQRVQMYLERKRFPGFQNLVVQAEKGIVTISGRLENAQQRDNALNSCRRVAGVLSLIDAIVIEEPRPTRISRNPR